MVQTIEMLEKEYDGKEKDLYYYNMQAVLGTEDDSKSAYDDNGNFHCIKWFDCRYCPAFNSNYCI